MGREEDIPTVIDGLDGFTFQKFARRLLQRELYPDLNPLPDQNDLGQDARSDELPVTDLPDLQQESGRITFAISKTTTKQKVTDDCDSCRENSLDVDTFIFVTSGDVSNKQRRNWEEAVETEYGWELTIYDRTWFSDIATKPDHEKLVDEVLGVPPLHGDYHEDILEAFAQITDDTLSPIETTLPYLNRRIDRSETPDILSRLSEGQSILLTGNAGVGKTGILGQVVDRWTSTPTLFIDARRFSEVSNSTELRQEFDFNGPLADAISRLGHHDGCLLVVDQVDNIGGTPAAALFTDLLTEVAELDNVKMLVGCRQWDLRNRDVYAPLTESEAFESVGLSGLSESAVRTVLDELGISDYCEELITLATNLLNLSIIAELREQTALDQIDYSQIKSQVELWDRYQETLVERETQGAEWDRESGYEVRARAIELAERGLSDGTRVVPISLRRNRADERLISRNVLQHERGERYRFRHDELQDYFCAWNAVQRQGWTTPRPVLEEIDEQVAAGVFRWMLRMLFTEDAELAAEFLDDALAPDGLSYYAATTIIDEIMGWEPQEHPDHLLESVMDRIEKREELCRYFYTNLSNPEWGSILHDQGRFEDPTGPHLAYLDSVATDVPSLVTGIIDSTQTEDERIRAYFVRIAESLPPEHATTNLDRFEAWLPDPTVNTGPYNVHYTNFLESLLEEGERDAALSLLQTLLAPQDPDPKTLEHEFEGGETVEHKIHTEATALADSYTIENAIQNTWEALADDDRDDLLQILEDQLRAAIALEAEERGGDPADLQWPTDIGDSSLNNVHLKEVLLEELRDGLKEWIGEDPSDDTRREWVTRYLEDILLFRRLGLYLLRAYVEAYPDLVRSELLNDANFDDLGIRTEFFLLLREGFSTLDSGDRQAVLDIIETGPEEDELRELAEANQDRFPDRSVDQIFEQEYELWQLRRYWMIQEDLPEPYTEQIDDLIDRYGEPTHPESVIKTEGGAVSFTGPMDIEELRELSPAEILELCVTWDPEAEDESDFLTEVSPRGLAEDLRNLVSESPTEFVPHLPLLADADAVYIHHVFDALEDAVEEDTYFEWEPVIELCGAAVNRVDEGWANETRRKTCSLLRSGLSDHDSGLVDQHAADVRKILLTLADDPNPGLDAETDPDVIEHEDPIHTAFNSVRPVAVNALITYGLEKAKHDGFEGSDTEDESGMEGVVKAKLGERMEDPSTAVHSVFGQRLFNLRWIDSSLVHNNLETIFPRDDDSESRHRFVAAWSAYIRVNKWYTDAYDWLRDYYFHAVDLHAEEGWFTTNNAGDRFVAHILCSHLHTDETLGGDESLLTYFYRQSAPDLAGRGAWQLWRWGNENAEFRDRWPLIKELWGWRLDMAGDNIETHSREFRWYIEWLDLVSDRIDLEEVETILVDTIPYIFQDRRSWETLETFLADAAADSPLASIRIYKALVDQPKWPDYLDFDETTWTLLETAFEAGGESKEFARGTAEEIAVRDPEYLELLREYQLE